MQMFQCMDPFNNNKVWKQEFSGKGDRYYQNDHISSTLIPMPPVQKYKIQGTITHLLKYEIHCHIQPHLLLLFSIKILQNACNQRLMFC